MWSVASFAIVSACYVGPLPCTYGDSSGRIRASMDDLVQDLDLEIRVPLRASRAHHRRPRESWPSDQTGRTIHIDIQSGK